MSSRRLTISASDKFGLPTALDDEVILGLVQLSKADNFANRQVQFSRYQLVHLLGWRDEGKSYTRLEESLKRWLGVTLYYENAWWDKCRKRWVDAHFHLLDNVTLYHRSKRGERSAKMTTAGRCRRSPGTKSFFGVFRPGISGESTWSSTARSSRRSPSESIAFSTNVSTSAMRAFQACPIRTGAYRPEPEL